MLVLVHFFSNFSCQLKREKEKEKRKIEYELMRVYRIFRY